jgi:hypothetical protein
MLVGLILLTEVSWVEFGGLMLLQFLDGNTFAVGAIQYRYAPASPQETTNRIILPITIDVGKSIATQAVLDTGAPYGIITPDIAKAAGYTSDLALERETLKVRGLKLNGSLVRLNITLQASIGQNLTVDATTFIPDINQNWGEFAPAWGEFPIFVGLSGFLERIRFAIDPTEDRFYFGTP